MECWRLYFWRLRYRSACWQRHFGCEPRRADRRIGLTLPTNLPGTIVSSEDHNDPLALQIPTASKPIPTWQTKILVPPATTLLSLGRLEQERAAPRIGTASNSCRRPTRPY